MTRSVSIRIMGDKKLAEKIISHIIRLLETNGYDFSAPKYLPYYRNKKQRTKENIDPTKTRAYLTVYGTFGED